MTADRYPRVLVIDDDREILHQFRDVLEAAPPVTQELARMETALFGAADAPQGFACEVCLCQGGAAGVAAQEAARAAGTPFQVAFVDFRMPPGPDGVAVAIQLRQADPQLQIVLVSAYADMDDMDVRRRIPPVDKLLVLKKPLHVEEIRQVTAALVAKWELERQGAQLARELELRVAQRTEELCQERAALRTVLDAVQAGVLVVAGETNTVYESNPFVSEILGLSPERLAGRPLETLLQPVPRPGDNLQPAVLHGAKGGTRQVLASLTGLYAPDGEHRLCTFVDVTRLEEARSRIRQSEDAYRAIFENTGTGCTILGGDNQLLLVNSHLSQLLGCEGDGCWNWLEILAPDLHPLAQACHAAVLSEPEGTPVAYEGRLRRAEGGWIDALITVAALPSGRELILSVQDLTLLKEKEHELRWLSAHDPLTGLANRIELQRRLAALQQRAPQHPFAVMLLDLDRFKGLNDSLGHSAGDEVLRQVAGRFLRHMQPDEVVARFGGDEFILLFPCPQGVGTVARQAQNLLAECRQPFEVEGRSVQLSASIGIVLVDSATQSGSALLRDADIAMYRAKKAGGDRYEIFAPGMLQEVRERLELEIDLRQAVAVGELELHYQPLVELPAGRLVSREALVRWRHPQRGLVLPGDFIPLAEESGLILPLGAVALDLACRQLRQWRDAGDTTPVGVNISAHQLTHTDFVDDLLRRVEAYGLAPEMIILEFTESVLMQQTDEVLRRLARLRALGFHLCLDDFGTGYSSLSYLQRFAVDTIKIDRSFTAHLDDPRTRALVQTVIHLGRRLDINVVAEGIETADCAALLTTLGCPQGQGYHFGYPLPAAEISA